MQTNSYNSFRPTNILKLFIDLPAGGRFEMFIGLKKQQICKAPILKLTIR